MTPVSAVASVAEEPLRGGFAPDQAPDVTGKGRLGPFAGEALRVDAHQLVEECAVTLGET